MELSKAPLKRDLLIKMTSILDHRGPDDEGYILINTQTGNCIPAGGTHTPESIYAGKFEYNPKTTISQIPDGSYDLGLGHRRLSILDLSESGHQPMCNEEGTIWIVHNGEIYNYIEIREELMSMGYRFLSGSDTEVIIKAYEEWGTDCLTKFNGMWALCIWDSVNHQLFCARDRMGVKPFYYYFDGRVFAFASEIKALMQMSIKKDPNDALIFDFLKFGILDHTNETFYKDIYKLPQSHFLSIDSRKKLSLHKYWDVEVSNELESVADEGNLTQQFLDLFVDSIKIRLRSDVPIGSCLSGGLDSSSIVTVANDLMYPRNNLTAAERQKTFSACYENRRFDERNYIEAVIKKTNAETNYVFPTAEGFLAELDNLLWHQDEPFVSSSIYAQWLVIRTAKEKGVTVLLDGQGGDEQLAGYRKFGIFYFQELLRRKRWSKLFSESSAFFLSPSILQTLNLRSGLRYFKFGNKILGIDDLLKATFLNEFQGRTPDIGYRKDLGNRIKDDLFKFSLPALLRYEDRNSMAHAVEARLPFLDYRLVEMLAALPFNHKLRNGWTKYILRNALKGILPEKIILRKSKLGFDTPEDIWFRSVMRKELYKTFDKPAFINHYIDSEKLSQSFAKYMNNSSFLQSNIFFRFFILELWGRKFILNPPITKK